MLGEGSSVRQRLPYGAGAIAVLGLGLLTLCRFHWLHCQTGHVVLATSIHVASSPASTLCIACATLAAGKQTVAHQSPHLGTRAEHRVVNHIAWVVYWRQQQQLATARDGIIAQSSSSLACLEQLGHLLRQVHAYVVHVLVCHAISAPCAAYESLARVSHSTDHQHVAWHTGLAGNRNHLQTLHITLQTPKAGNRLVCDHSAATVRLLQPVTV
jgi:hypothetical protein